MRYFLNVDIGSSLRTGPKYSNGQEAISHSFEMAGKVREISAFGKSVSGMRQPRTRSPSRHPQECFRTRDLQVVPASQLRPV
jgi:hypothetical protein